MTHFKLQKFISMFMTLVLALFAAAVPIRASSGLTNGGYHDDGVGPDGNHYFELYWYSTDPNIDCTPYTGSNGYISVYFSGAQKVSGSQWVPAYDVFQSYAGVSGFSHHECQVNVFAANGTGLREVQVGWTLNGTTQPGTYGEVFTF